MCYKFLYEEPKFDNDIKNYTVDFVFNLDRNGDYCYIFNVDIHCPSKLHHRNDEFPILS